MANKHIFRPADIGLIDADFLFARIIKFLMKYRSIWRWIFRYPPDTVHWYHALLVRDYATVIEQQWKVRIASHRQIIDKPCVVWRCPHLTSNEVHAIINEAESMLGQSYDVLSFLGSMLRWFTGISWFERAVQNRKKERCHTFVARCYCVGAGIMFGRHHWSEVETDDIDQYAKHEGWERVHINEG